MDPTILGLEGKVAIVAGGGRNIGRGCSLMLARAGCDVCVADIDPENGRRVAEEITALGSKAHFQQVDVRELGQIEEMVRTTVSELGGLDVAVNVVGGWGGHTWTHFLDFTPRHFDDVVTLNFRSAFFCTQQEAKSMVERGVKGSIVNVSSAGGLRARQGSSAYGASKGAVNNLTMQAAFELGEHGIRVNCIAPAFVPGGRVQAGDESIRPVAQANPLRRLPLAEEVGGAAVMLTSDLSSYVTGQTIPVDGGDTFTSGLGGITAGGGLDKMLSRSR